MSTALFCCFSEKRKKWTLAAGFLAFTGVFGKNIVFSWNTHRDVWFLCKWAKSKAVAAGGFLPGSVCEVWMVLKGKRILRLASLAQNDTFYNPSVSLFG